MEKLKKIFEIVIPAICSLAAVGTFLFLVIYLAIVPAKEIPNRDLLLLLTGILAGIVKDLFGYWFGSSAGSKTKTEMMDKMNNPPANIPVQ